VESEGCSSFEPTRRNPENKGSADRRVDCFHYWTYSIFSFLITLKVQLFSLRGAHTEPEPKEENPHGQESDSVSEGFEFAGFSEAVRHRRAVPLHRVRLALAEGLAVSGMRAHWSLRAGGTQIVPMSSLSPSNRTYQRNAVRVHEATTDNLVPGDIHPMDDAYSGGGRPGGNVGAVLPARPPLSRPFRSTATATPSPCA